MIDVKKQETPAAYLQPGSPLPSLHDCLGAEDEIRTRDLLLGKEMLYH